MLAISLMRMGAKGKPFYRVVVKEKRSKRDGAYIENLGTYNPMTNPAEVKTATPPAATTTTGTLRMP